MSRKNGFKLSKEYSHKEKEQAAELRIYSVSVEPSPELPGDLKIIIILGYFKKKRYVVF